MDVIQFLINPQTIVIVLVAISAFATVLTLLLPAFDRDRGAERMKAVAMERDRMRAMRNKDQTRLRDTPTGIMQDLVTALDLRSIFDNKDLRNKLKMAGLRGEGPVVAFMFFRVIMPPALTILTLLYLFIIAKNITWSPTLKILASFGAGGLGFYVPNIFINNVIQKRQESIKYAFPDSLDMLLICVQAGMSIEAAFGKVASEIGSQSIELAEELTLTTAELSFLSERRQAYENLGIRTGLPGVKAVAVALSQAEKYGTPIGTALRTMAKENRDIRMSEAERKAAALPPKLTVPMIIFFLPVLFVVILGPALIQVFKWQ